MVRAVGYGRLSDEDGGQSVERQESYCQGVAKENGWELDTVLKEWVPASLLHKPPSRTSKKYRQQWRVLIDGIHAGKWDAIVFWMADRSGRHALYGLELVDACKAAKVTMVHIDDRIYNLLDPYDEAKYMRAVAEAQEEVAKMSKRIRAAKLQLAEDGAPNTGGNRPFGNTGTGRQRVPLHRALAEQECIIDAADRVIAGDSLRAIVRDWNAAKVRTSTGGEWTPASLRQMLLSPRLAGYRVHHGRLIATKHWTAILDRAIWEQVRAILTDPSRITTVGGGQPKYLLVGWIYCGTCGARLRCKLQRHGSTTHKYLAYYCPKFHVARSATAVESLILRGLFQAAEDRNRYADAAKSLADGDPGRDLYAKLAANQGRLDRLGDDELVARLDDDLTRAERIARVRARLEGDMARDREALARMQGDRIMAALPANLRQVWPDLSLDRRRSILGVLFDGKAILVCRQGSHVGFVPDAVKVVALSDVPGQR
jgi:site-specific DNA recombinase